MNKKGDFSSLFIFIIMTFIIVVFSGVIIYITGQVHTQLDILAPSLSTASTNMTEIVDDTFAPLEASFTVLYWGTFLIIIGMIVSIFIGNFMVQTHPVFFVPYVFITAISVIVSVPISNTYETLATTTVLSDTFLGFAASNLVLRFLPLWVTAIGFVGAIILFSKLIRGEEYQ